MSEQMQPSDNLHMTTRLTEHDCTFTWRLRNLSLLTSMKEGARQEFTLHPECDKKWKLLAKSHSKGITLEVDPVVGLAKLSDDSYLEVNLNQKGEFVKKHPFTPYILDYHLKSNNGKITTGCGKVVEVEDDTLVVKGRVVLPSCCPRTEIHKGEATEPLDLCKLMDEELNVA